MKKVILVIVSFVVVVFSAPAYALTQQQLFSINNDSVYYDPGSQSGCTPLPSLAGGSSITVAVSTQQQQNIETIIGIAKTDNLGQNAAIIALMVARDESGFLNLANVNVPLSEQNVNSQGNGSNGVSLGVFQQQITDNWSTISSSINSVPAINQLMTPAYAAEAFFGSPPGTNTSSALTKGLMDIGGWQNLSLQTAAQAVQLSGTPDGSNYGAFKKQAESLVQQYWSVSPAIPLPVPFQDAGASSSSSNNLGSLNLSNCPETSNTGSSTQTYSNPFSSITNLVGRRVDQGVDFDGSGPVYAIGDGTVLNLYNSGWPAGNFIVYQLSTGPAAGLYVYVAEDCTPNVTIGENITSSTVVCTMYDGNSGIEIGWASTNLGTSEAYVLGQASLGQSQKDPGLYSTGMGINFLDLLQSLGLTLSSGANTINKPIQTQNMPSNLPTWN